MVRIIVEMTHDPPLQQDSWNQASGKLIPCLQLRGIHWLHSWLSLDGCRTICELEAMDAETVRESYRKAGVSFDRVWTAEVREGGSAEGDS